MSALRLMMAGLEQERDSAKRHADSNQECVDCTQQALDAAEARGEQLEDQNRALEARVQELEGLVGQDIESPHHQKRARNPRRVHSLNELERIMSELTQLSEPITLSPELDESMEHSSLVHLEPEEDASSII